MLKKRSIVVVTVLALASLFLVLICIHTLRYRNCVVKVSYNSWGSTRSSTVITLRTDGAMRVDQGADNVINSFRFSNFPLVTKHVTNITLTEQQYASILQSVEMAFSEESILQTELPHQSLDASAYVIWHDDVQQVIYVNDPLHPELSTLCEELLDITTDN